jgi:hypothetical protein
MFRWLRGERKSEELPEYSALRSIPTRGLPSEVTETEAGEAFIARQTALSRSSARLLYVRRTINPS